MEVAKRQGRSEDQSEDFRQNKQHSWLSPICIGQAQGEEKTYKRRSQRARSLSLSPSRALTHSPTLFSSCLPVGMPSRLEDGFSCYFLNKIEL